VTEKQAELTEAAEVVVVDDVPEVREMVVAGLRASRRFAVVAEGSNGEEAVELAARHRPALMVLDISMPGMSGEDLLGFVKAHRPRTPVVFISGSTNEERAERLLTRRRVACTGRQQRQTVLEAVEKRSGIERP